MVGPQELAEGVVGCAKEVATEVLSGGAVSDTVEQTARHIQNFSLPLG